jgi:hypothetical protein
MLVIGEAAPQRVLEHGTAGEGRNSCGAIALYLASGICGRPVTFEKLFELLPNDGNAKTLADLQAAARQLGLHTQAVRWESRQALRVPTPCIVALRRKEGEPSSHFVVLLASREKAVCLIDPPHQPVWLDIRELRDHWDGVGVYIAPTPDRLKEIEPTTAPRTLSVVMLLIIAVAVLAGVIRLSLRHGKWGPHAWCALGTPLLFTSAWLSFSNPVTHEAIPFASFDPHTVEHIIETHNGEGPTTEFSFEMSLRNDGEQPVRLKGVRTNCACARAEWRAEVIAPHGDMPVTVTVRMSGVRERRIKLFALLENASPDVATGVATLRVATLPRQ